MFGLVHYHEDPSSTVRWETVLVVARPDLRSYRTNLIWIIPAKRTMLLLKSPRLLLWGVEVVSC